MKRFLPRVQAMLMVTRWPFLAFRAALLFNVAEVMVVEICPLADRFAA